jgi:ABC-type polysaccharide transport system permease subunit
MDGWLSVLLIVVLSAIGLAIYLAPSLVAIGRRNETQILLLNIFLGWTVIVWIVLLVMALSSRDSDDEEARPKKRKRKK